MTVYNEQSVYFFHQINPVLELNEDGEKSPYVEWEVFREGTFYHFWYGDIDFDYEYLNKIVQNFNNGVCPTMPSLNVDHIPERGAYGWVEPGINNMYVKQRTYSSPAGGTQTKNILCAKVKLTKKGMQAIEDEEFKYLSSEIHPDWSSPEVFKQADGSTIQPKYGPVFTGLALTNRPFIPNLMSVFSENGVKESVVDFQPHFSNDAGSDAGRFVAVKFNNLQPQPKKAEEPIVLSLKGDSMKFSEVLNKIEGKTPAEAVATIELSLSSLEGDDQATAKAYAAQMKQLDASNKLQQEFSGRLAKLEQERVDASKQIFSARVTGLGADLAKMGATPAVVEAVSQVFNAMPHDAAQMEFNLGETKMDLVGAIKHIFSKLPDHAFVAPPVAVAPVVLNDNDEPNDPADPPEEGGKTIPPRVQKFADRHGYKPEDVNESLWDNIDESGLLGDRALSKR